jgi:hypothetical protein
MTKPLSTRAAIVQYFSQNVPGHRYSLDELTTYVNGFRKHTPYSTVKRAQQELKNQRKISYVPTGHRGFEITALYAGIVEAIEPVEDATGGPFLCYEEEAEFFEIDEQESDLNLSGYVDEDEEGQL